MLRQLTETRQPTNGCKRQSSRTQESQKANGHTYGSFHECSPVGDAPATAALAQAELLLAKLRPAKEEVA
jgi:hypothetical protein